MTATGFVRWAEYFKKRRTETKPEHHYFAEGNFLLYTLLRSWTKGLPTAKLKDFLKTFKVESELTKLERAEQEEEDLTPEEVTKRSVLSKQSWFALVFRGQSAEMLKKG